jgi:hypothetical protein
MNWWRSPAVLLVLVLISLLCVWTISGYDSVYIDTDVGRDLKEISNIQRDKYVWLGPWIGPGLHASSVYYYLYYPGVWLSSGVVSSLITTNLVIAVISFALLGWPLIQRYHWQGAVLLLWIGLLPMVVQNVLHPGNGFTYLFFALASVGLLWFQKSLWLGSLLAGLAAGLHPAAGFLPGLIALEWWRRGRSWLAAALAPLAFLLPFAPLIAFEIITRGYIVRKYLEHRSTNGIALEFSLENVNLVANLLGLNLVTATGLLLLASVVVWKFRRTQDRWWWVFVCALLVGISLFTGLIGRYFFAVAALFALFIGLQLIRFRFGMIILLVLTMQQVLSSPLMHPYPYSGRSISDIEHTAEKISSILGEIHVPIGVVAALSQRTEVPQADDYRYLLRYRGYDVLDVTKHEQAQVLVMVIEVEGFSWQTWSNWEIETFGEKRVRSVTDIGDATVVVFESASGVVN